MLSYKSVLILLIVGQLCAQEVKICDKQVPDSTQCSKDSCDDSIKILLCQRFCKVCIIGEAEKLAQTTSTTTTTTTTTASPTRSGGCKDKNILCQFRANDCSTDIDVRADCPMSCGLCPGGSSPLPPVSTVKPTSSTPATEPTTPTTTQTNPTKTSPTSPTTALPSTNPSTQPSPSVKTSTDAPTPSTDKPSTKPTSAKQTPKPTKPTTAKLTTPKSTTHTPATPKSTTAVVPTEKPDLRTAIRVEVLSDGSLLIELIMFNYQTYNELKTTTGEVEKFLEQQGFPVGNVRVVGIKDENTASGDPTTTITMHVSLKAGKTAKEAEGKFNKKGSQLRNNLNSHLMSKSLKCKTKSCKIFHTGAPPIAAPQITKKEDSWATKNWYVIFGIAVATLLVVILFIMALAVSSRAKTQKLNLQEKKLASSKV